MKRRRRRQPGRDGGFGIAARLLTGLAAALIAVALLDLQMRPAIEDMIAYQAQLYAMRTINTAMLRELEASNIRYDDIAHLSRTGDGTVTSIQTDVIAVNRLKARMADAVLRELEEMGQQSIQVPLGTLLGYQLTAGRGPEVEIRIVPVGFVQSELYNHFQAAGINQTLHQIMLQTGVQIAAVLPGYKVKTETTTSFCLAETVIVGTVPDGYTIVGEDGSSTIAKINDYKADK